MQWPAHSSCPARPHGPHFPASAPRPAVEAPLRAADPSVPAWQRFDRYTVSFVERRADGSTVLSLQTTENNQRHRTITLRGSW